MKIKSARNFRMAVVTLPVAAGLMAGLMAGPVLAGQVVLSPKSGGFDFEGDLKSFDGTTYVLETATGSMALPASGFECTAGECAKPGSQIMPASAAPAPAGPPRIAIHGAAIIGTTLMPALLSGFAAKKGERVWRGAAASANEIRLDLAVTNPIAGGDGSTAQIDLHTDGTASGLAALARGDAQIAMASRPIRADEIAKLPALQRGHTSRYQAHVIGLDGVAILISPQRKLDALTLNQLALIFSGRMTNWSELGLEPGAIKLYAPDAGNGTLDVFAETVLRPLGLAVSPYAIRSSDYAAMSDAVAKDPNAIAIDSLAHVRQAKAIAIEAACGIVSIPSPFSVKTEEYPLSRRLTLYTAGAQQAVAADFLRYAQSSEAQTVVTQQSFVGQAIDETAYANESQRINEPGAAGTVAETILHRQLVTDLSPAKRLSVTFRFAISTSQLDARSRADIERLASYLRTPGHEAQTVHMAGFSDSIGALPLNVSISLRRAAQVREAVLAAGSGAIKPERITVSGYGPLSPVACNTTAEGQNLNRRVEVWLKN